MPFFASIIAAVIGWAVWTGKIKLQQLPPVLLGLAGVFITLRGQFIIGIPAILIASAWYRGLNWRLFGTKAGQSPQYAIDKARHLLGATPHDDAEMIRTRHRRLISGNHPDTGGSDARAAMLNQARDLLLAELQKRNL
jgi:hypothetical protein